MSEVDSKSRLKRLAVQKGFSVDALLDESFAEACPKCSTPEWAVRHALGKECPKAEDDENA